MTVLELFAGGGGAALGLHAAGLHGLARVEWDRDACATLRAAAEAGFLGEADVIEGDVRGVDYSRFAGVDLLWASPPCQCWSTAGKRLGARDDRNLWPATWAAIDAARPRWFIAENVAGMLHHRGDCDGKGDPADCPACWFHRVNLPEIARRFAWCGWAVLDSADYGVPQSRRRVYTVAGPRPVRWPEATHADPAIAAQASLFGRRLRPWVSVDVVTALRGWLWGEGVVGAGLPTPTSTIAPTLKAKGTLALTATNVSPGAWGAPRVAASDYIPLMAWPRGYPVQGNQTERYRVVGNGCTPPVVEALARAVMAADSC